ncbi:MAG: GntR family transcriptional regulator [Ruminococcaceae bacterium]|nr:GntR family transcriptional regulator [Oscillospiraceae bacterium]
MNGSLADFVFESLENDILSGVYARGEILTELKLCERLGVSRTPIREALNRLKQQQLVEETSSHSVRVRGVSQQDLMDIYEIRLRIEGYAARLCALRITEEELNELREIVALQDFYTARGGAANIRDMDSRFHELVYRYCGSEILMATLSELHHRVQRYRKISVEHPDRAEVAVKEHAAILGALEGHDADEAERLTVLHIENAKKCIVLATSAVGESK